MAAANYKTKRVRYQGRDWTYDEIAERLGMNIYSIRNRVLMGWTPEEVIETPKGRTPDRILKERIQEGRNRGRKSEQGQKILDSINRQLTFESEIAFGCCLTPMEALSMRWVGGS